VGIFLKAQVETSYYDQFKDNINSGIKALTIKENAAIDDIYTDLRNDGNGKRLALQLFYFTSQYKTFTIVDSTKIDSENIRSSDGGFNESYNENKQKFINEIKGSDNFTKALSSKTPAGKAKLMSFNGRSFFDYAYPLEGTDFILYFRYYSDDWQQIINNFNEIILSSTLIIMLVVSIIGYLIAKTITVPIVRIMNKAQAMAEGDFDQVIDVKSADEIGKLTETFNYMANTLKNNLNEISSEKSKIETILNYMTDGVIAFNLEGEVIHENPASKRILEENETIGSFDVFSLKHNLGISLQEVLYTGLLGSKEKSIVFNNKFIRAYFALFTDEEDNPEGIITVLQDVTEQQKLENMRKEFVANVSHELRTPLTSIKSYTETLLDGALEDRDTTVKFLKVVNSESDRMTRLVKDLLQLTSLDNQQMKWDMKKISFVQLVQNAMEKLKIEASNKEQALERHIIGTLPDITADHDRIEQVVLNILSNAIKYTPKGGKITVYLGKMYNDVYVKVTDTGVGIPKDDLERVFERFYRVDKARSREMGGTGLGLSIAKEIVEAHNGTISVNSELGIGTEIVVKLPSIPMTDR